MKSKILLNSVFKNLVSTTGALSMFLLLLIQTQTVFAQTPPSNILPDIVEFKLEYPLDEDGDDYEGVSYDDRDDPLIKYHVIDGDDLGGYVAPNPFRNYFFVSGSEVVFRAHCAGALSSANSYPRCELRQQINGENSFWEYDDEQELNATFRITELPDNKQEVCVLQIKGNTSLSTSGTEEVMRLEYRADNSQKLHLVHNEDNTDTDIMDYSLGDYIEARLHVNNNVVTVELENTTQNKSYSKTYSTSYDYGYFKAGCYTQSSIWSEKSGVADEDPDAYGEVRFSRLVLGADNNNNNNNNTTTTTTNNGCDSYNAFSNISAANYCDDYGVQIASGNVGYIQNNDWISFEDVQFGSTARSITASLSSGSSGGNVEVRSGSSSGTLLGTLNVGNTGGWKSFTDVSTNISNTSGTQDIYFVFKGGNGYLLDIASFQFSTSTVGGSNTTTTTTTTTTNNGCDSYNAFSNISAANYCDDYGVQIASGNVGYIQNNDWISFEDIQFGSTARSITASLSSGSSGGNVEVRTGSSSGTLLGTLSVGNTGGWKSFTNVSANINNTSGSQDIFLVFKGNNGYLLDIASFQFSTSSVGGSNTTTTTTTNNGSTGDIVTMRKRNAINYALDGNGGAIEGQNIYLYNYNASNVNQQWVEIDRGNGHYTYQKNNTNLCMDGGDDGSTYQKISLEVCSSGDEDQHWKKINMDGDYYRLEKRNAESYSLDGKGGGDNGQEAHLWTNNNNNYNQHWLFTVVGNSSGREVFNSIETTDHDLVIFPNPFEAELNVTIPESIEGLTSITLTDFLGRRVFQHSDLQPGTRLNISNGFTKGAYILRWIDSDGQVIQVKKVMHH